MQQFCPFSLLPEVAMYVLQMKDFEEYVGKIFLKQPCKISKFEDSKDH